jgi:GNAT superfamily N-acetyltransferase
MRRAVPADAAAIWAIHTRAIRETASSHYAPESIAAWSGRTTPASYLVPIATQVVVVACDDADRIVGFAELDPAEGLVKACYVDPDVDRRGVGRALMQAVERAACEHGRTALMLDASLNALPFYQALGWQRECATRHELAPGAWLDCAIMTKRIG